jgi:hypothetical protein
MAYIAWSTYGNSIIQDLAKDGQAKIASPKVAQLR